MSTAKAFTSVCIAPGKAMAGVSGVKSELAVLKWMVGFNPALTLAVLVKDVIR